MTQVFFKHFGSKNQQSGLSVITIGGQWVKGLMLGFGNSYELVILSIWL